MIRLPGRGYYIDLDSDCCGECSKLAGQLARLARGNLAVLLAAKEHVAYNDDTVTADTWRAVYFAMVRHRVRRHDAGDPVLCW